MKQTSIHENWHVVSYMVLNNPLVVTGLLLIGASGFLAMHMQLKIVRSGNKVVWERWLTRRGHEVAFDYLSFRASTNGPVGPLT